MGSSSNFLWWHSQSTFSHCKLSCQDSTQVYSLYIIWVWSWIYILTRICSLYSKVDTVSKCSSWNNNNSIYFIILCIYILKTNNIPLYHHLTSVTRSSCRKFIDLLYFSEFVLTSKALSFSISFYMLSMKTYHKPKLPFLHTCFIHMKTNWY